MAVFHFSLRVPLVLSRRGARLMDGRFSTAGVRLLPTLELVSIVVDVVHLRQAGLARTVVEDQLVQTRRLPRHAARRLIGQVEQELQSVRRRLGLPLALSAESLLADCIEVRPTQPTRN